MKTGIDRIDEERCRQIQAEGFDPAHDDKHTGHELRYAAICYEEAAAMQIGGERTDYLPVRWPWESEWWKPGDVFRNLEKAGALYRAEAERSARSKSGNWEIYLEGMNAAARRCGEKIDKLSRPPAQLNQEELYSALGELMARIEACGASIELTNAVSLAGDIRQAIGNQWNQPDSFAADRVRIIIPPATT